MQPRDREQVCHPETTNRLSITPDQLITAAQEKDLEKGASSLSR
jgi:hypothetical protein